MRVSLSALPLVAAVLLASSAQADARWPSFQNGGDVSLGGSDASPWLGDLTTEWTAAVPGHGQASPVVWDDRLYVTSTEGENKEAYRLTCLSTDDGTKLWDWVTDNPTPKPNNVYTSRAAPTPVADENGVTVFFEGGVLAGLSHEGDLRWKRNLIEEYGGDDTRFGQSGSIEQDGGTGYLWFARRDGDYVLAFEKATGETTWKVDGPGVTSWASPRLVPVSEGVEHLVLSGGGTVAGLDPADGAILWRTDGLSGNTTPTPVPMGGGRFLIGASQGRGEISESDAAGSNAVFQIEAAGDGYAVAKVWGAERATSSFGTPIVHNGIAWIVNRSGVLYALDAETGEKKAAGRISGSIWATPVGVGDAVLFPTKDGAVDFVSADAEASTLKTYQVLPTPEEPEEPAEGRGRGGNFGGAILYGVAVVGDRLYVRDGDAVYCVTPKG